MARACELTEATAMSLGPRTGAAMAQGPPIFDALLDSERGVLTTPEGMRAYLVQPAACAAGSL